MNNIKVIGTVKSRFRQKADPFEMRKHESEIIIKREYEEGLYRIEESRFLQVLFLFHLSEGYSLTGKRYFGEEKGVFASRSPERPSPIGLAAVELLERTGPRLKVKGLDAVEGTPVIDIKPYVPGLDSPADDGEADLNLRPVNPGRQILPLVKNGDMDQLLALAGELHGHFCPGLSLGVMAGAAGLHKLGEILSKPLSFFLGSEGLEEIICIVEINSCFADGIQAVTGCTLGNNELIYRETGKTAVSITDRAGRGVRVCVRTGFRDILESTNKEFFPLFEQVIINSDRNVKAVEKFKKVSMETGFAILKVPLKEIFSIEEKNVEIPRFAPVRKSVVCSGCGESVMEDKGHAEGPVFLCRPCSNIPCYTLTGAGIAMEKL